MTFAEQISRKFASNRVFWDNIVLVVWCEQAIPFEQRKAEQKAWWLDMMLPYYVGKETVNRLKAEGRTNDFQQVTRNTFHAYRTAKEVLTQKEIEALQTYIDTHHTRDRIAFRQSVNDEGIFTYCQTSSMEVLGVVAKVSELSKIPQPRRSRPKQLACENSATETVASQEPKTAY